MEDDYPKDIRKWAQDLADQLADHISNLDLSDYLMKEEDSMTINEIKDYINSHEFYDIEDLCDELGENIDINYIENLDRDEHRWFTTEINVYEFIEGAKSLGYLAISEIGTIKSEMMGVEDCGVALEAYNVKRVIRESFEITNE